MSLYFIKTIKSEIFDCENSGYSHVAALTALIVSLMDPEILINYRYYLIKY